MLTDCVAQLAKALDTQAVGRGSIPDWTLNICMEIFRSILV